MADASATTPAASAAPPAGGVQTFACPNCGGTIGIRAAGLTVSAVCEHCHSIVGVDNENLKIISKASAAAVRSALPIGGRGKLFDVEWEIIGFMVRSDPTEKWKWCEYLLFNPWEGFRFLVEAEGHWNFVRMLRRNIRGGAGVPVISYEDEIYRLYVYDGAKVLYVMGEFYWTVKVGEKVMAADYIAPPYMLSMERSGQDIIWSQAVYVEASEVASAFGAQALPGQSGVAPDQPSPFEPRYKSTMMTCAMFLVALIAVQIAGLFASHSQTLYANSYMASPGEKGQTVISTSFTAPEDTVNLWIHAFAPVDNNWLELDTSLVNLQTQADYGPLLSIEYWHGYDSDGSWSEGSRNASHTVGDAAPGNYQFTVSPDAGAFEKGNPQSFEIEIKNNVPIWSNFWISLVLIIIWPAVYLFRRRNFEVQRWSNSDYSPYASDDDE
ncbi:MAG TPA: DUF4178 domain-containing protein [Patescibacteria group bacterium]|jgi:hypothetical protein|nr:DUF4178 domain-containing protein [Patescibacteria group bacterium]